MSGRVEDLSIQTERGLPAAEVRSILDSLPEWFGRPEAIAAYAAEAEGLEAMTARHDEQLIGLLTLKPSSAVATEIAVMAVKPQWQRRGAGRALIEAAVTHLMSRKQMLVWLQTVGPSYDDAAYAGTRAFYATAGFAPLLELPEHFGDGVPAILMVRSLPM